jgi:hypothetical protein
MLCLNFVPRGFLVPVKHQTDEGDVPCYYLPPPLSSAVRAALPLLPRVPKEISDRVRTELRNIGYPAKEPEGNGQKQD